MRKILCGLVLLLAGCNDTVEPTSSDKALLEKWIAEDQAPLRPKLVASWHAFAEPSSLICAEIEAPPGLPSGRRTLRLYFDQPRGFGQVEYHELWAGDALAMATIELNRSAFNDLWEKFCQPYAPIGRRVAQFLGK